MYELIPDLCGEKVELAVRCGRKAFGFLNRPANLGIASPAPLSSLAPVQSGTRDCRYLNQPARLGQAWRAGALIFSIFSPFRAPNHQQHREDGYRDANT